MKAAEGLEGKMAFSILFRVLFQNFFYSKHMFPNSPSISDLHIEHKYHVYESFNDHYMIHNPPFFRYFR